MVNRLKIIIGCMSWGSWGKNLSVNEQSTLMNFCMEQGNNTFDHADIYGDYTTEKEFGKAFHESKILREQIQLISKCGIQIPGKSRNNTVKHYNYSKDYIIWSAEESLKNLKTDYLDTFLLHRPSPLMQVDEIAEAISRLQKSGKILQFGVSNFNPSQLELLSTKIKVSVNQIEFSLTNHQAMQNGTLDFMQIKNIQPMSWKPLGTIFKENSEQNHRISEVLKILSKKYQCQPDTLLLAWILKHPSMVSPVIGTTNVERIKNAKNALTIDLELEDWFLMLNESQGYQIP